MAEFNAAFPNSNTATVLVTFLRNSSLSAAQLNQIATLVKAVPNIAAATSFSDYEKAVTTVVAQIKNLLTSVSGDQLGITIVEYFKADFSVSSSYGSSSSWMKGLVNLSSDVLKKGIELYGTDYPEAKAQMQLLLDEKDSSITWEKAKTAISYAKSDAITLGRIVKAVLDALFTYANQENLERLIFDRYLSASAGKDADGQAALQAFTNDPSATFKAFGDVIGALRFNSASQTKIQAFVRTAIAPYVEEGVNRQNDYGVSTTGIPESSITAKLNQVKDIIENFDYRGFEACRHLVFELTHSLDKKIIDEIKASTSANPIGDLKNYYLAAYSYLSSNETADLKKFFAYFGLDYDQVYAKLISFAQADFSKEEEAATLQGYLQSLAQSIASAFTPTPSKQDSVGLYLSSATLLKGEVISPERIHISSMGSGQYKAEIVSVDFDTATLGYHTGHVTAAIDGANYIYRFNYIVVNDVPYADRQSQSLNPADPTQAAFTNATTVFLTKGASESQICDLYTSRPALKRNGTTLGKLTNVVVHGFDSSASGEKYVLVEGKVGTQSVFDLVKVRIYETADLRVSITNSNPYVFALEGRTSSLQLDETLSVYLSDDPATILAMENQQVTLTSLPGYTTMPTAAGDYPVTSETSTEQGTTTLKFTLHVLAKKDCTVETNLDVQKDYDLNDAFVFNYLSIEISKEFSDEETKLYHVRWLELYNERVYDQSKLSSLVFDSATAGTNKTGSFVFDGDTYTFDYNVYDLKSMTKRVERQLFLVGDSVYSTFYTNVSFYKNADDTTPLFTRRVVLMAPSTGGFDTSKALKEGTVIFDSKYGTISVAYTVYDPSTLTTSVDYCRVLTDYVVGQSCAINELGLLYKDGDTFVAERYFSQQEMTSDAEPMTLTGFSSEAAVKKATATLTFHGASYAFTYNVYGADEVVAQTYYRADQSFFFVGETVYEKGGTLLTTYSVIADSSIRLSPSGKAYEDSQVSALVVDTSKAGNVTGLVTIDGQSYPTERYQIYEQSELTFQSAGNIPFKSAYLIGEDFAMGVKESSIIWAEFIVHGTYHSFALPLSQIVPSGFDSTTAGTKTMTLSLIGYNYSIQYTVYDPSACSFSLIDFPESVSVGTSFADLSSALVMVSLPNGDTYYHSLDESIISDVVFDTTSAGEKSGSFKIYGQTVSFSYTVVATN